MRPLTVVAGTNVKVVWRDHVREDRLGAVGGGDAALVDELLHSSRRVEHDDGVVEDLERDHVAVDFGCIPANTTSELSPSALNGWVLTPLRELHVKMALREDVEVADDGHRRRPRRHVPGPGTDVIHIVH